MKQAFLLVLLSIFATGCSDSASQSTPSYPMQLAIVNYTKPAQTGYFTLQVTKGGNAVTGAKLTVLLAPSGQLDTVVTKSGANVMSDSKGSFLFEYTPGAATGIAFQAVKDTLVSNYVRF